MLEQGICRLETIPTSRIDSAASEALAPWRRPLAVHDPGNIVLDLAIALALGGDCLADVNLLRTEPGVFGRVASDPTVSRLVDTLAADVDRALAAIKQAQATARQKVWALAGECAPDHSTDASAPLIIDLDATLVTSHSEKEHAAPTFKRGYGFHPPCARSSITPERDRGAVAADAATRQRGIEHRHRPHLRHQEGDGATSWTSAAGSEGLDPCRCCGGDSRLP
jgi:hypothetical protein